MNAGAEQDAQDDAPTTSPTSSPSSVRRRSAIAILLFAGVLIAASLGDADRDHATWFGYEGPTCPLREVIGDRRCPGCGLTRATVLTVHGRFVDAFQTHPAGWFIPVFAVAGVLLHADIARQGAVRASHRRLQRIGRGLFLACLVIAGLIRVLL